MPPSGEITTLPPSGERGLVHLGGVIHLGGVAARVDKVWQGLLNFIMMMTVNISLTNDQLAWINKKAADLGLANRSEFMRNMLRFLAKREDLLMDLSDYPFVSPVTRSKTKIVNEFAKTGKYNKEFLKDLEKLITVS